MKTGTVILYRFNFKWYKPLTYLSWAIRLFTKSYYNHVAVIINNWEIPFIYEAIGKGVIARPLSKFLERKDAEYKILEYKYDIDEKEFAILASKLLGKKYDVNILFEQAYFRVTKNWIGKETERQLKKLACAEYVAFLYSSFDTNFTRYYEWSAEEFNKSNMFNTLLTNK